VSQFENIRPFWASCFRPLVSVISGCGKDTEEKAERTLGLRTECVPHRARGNGTDSEDGTTGREECGSNGIGSERWDRTSEEEEVGEREEGGKSEMVLITTYENHFCQA
jgi:hypothetical protein